METIDYTSIEGTRSVMPRCVHTTFKRYIVLLWTMLLFFCVVTPSCKKSRPPETPKPREGKTQSAKVESARKQVPPDEINRHINLGIAYMFSEKYSNAIIELKRVLEAQPNHFGARLNLAVAYLSLQKNDEGIEEAAKARDLRPDHPNAHFCLGLAYKKKLMYAEAEKELRKVLQMFPNDASSYYNLGAIYARQDQHEKAVEQFRKAAEIEPLNPSAHFRLGTSLQRLGKMKEAMKELLRHQELRKRETPSLEEGPFAKPLEDYEQIVPGGPVELSEPIAVKFTDVTAAVGLAQKSSSIKFPPNGVIKSQDYNLDYAKNNIVPAFGASAAFADYDGDGDLDLYVVRNSPEKEKSSNILYRNDDGKFVDVTADAGVGNDEMGLACTFGDYDNDNDLDLYVSNFGPNVLYRNEGNGKFTDVSKETGVDDPGFSVGAAFADYDHDADLDIFVANYVEIAPDAGPTNKPILRFPDDFKGQSNVLYSNNAMNLLKKKETAKTDKATKKVLPIVFAKVTDQAELTNSDRKSIAAVFSDFDNDNDVDIYVVNDGQPNSLYTNDRNGAFTDIAEKAGVADAGIAGGVAVADYNRNGFMDILLADSNNKGLRFFSNRRQNSFAEDKKPLPEGLVWKEKSTGGAGKRNWGICLSDYDNDGDQDLFILTSSAAFSNAEGKCVLLRNNGKASFTDVSQKCGLGAVKLADPRCVTAADYDNDGDEDILITCAGGRLVLLRNDGGNQNRWLKLKLIAFESQADKGKSNKVQSNRTAIGSKIDVRVGGVWQKKEINGGASCFSAITLYPTFGLGKKEKVDAVGVQWPSGARPFELDVATNKIVTIQEPRIGPKSCPMLYAWNGARYEFITDFLGGGIVGALVSPGVYNRPDTDEYVKIGRSQLKPRNGVYSLRITEQLEESAFIDRVQLVVVDHPKDTEIYPNERFMTSPPFPEFGIHVVKGARPPVAATDDKGNDVLPLIKKRDGDYFGPVEEAEAVEETESFKKTRFLAFPRPRGYANLHNITLDLGDLSNAKKVLLLMHGWTEYPDSSSNFAAFSDGLKLIEPFLQVRDEGGEWKTVIERTGFPAGLPKTMTLDLTGKFLTNDYTVRIVTNMSIYWDEILVSAFSGESPIVVTRLEPLRANLHWKGYPRKCSPVSSPCVNAHGKLPPTYDYDDVTDFSPWRVHAGGYTRYGDVTDLLRVTDDMYVIMRHGDEIAVELDAKSAPELARGWSRDFVLFADGFCKDLDPHSAHSATLEPLPFHAMSSYPYPANKSYPDDEAHGRYLRKYNTRHYSPSDIAGVMRWK